MSQPIKGKNRNAGSGKGGSPPPAEARPSAFPIILGLILLVGGGGIYFAMKSPSSAPPSPPIPAADSAPAPTGPQGVAPPAPADSGRVIVQTPANSRPAPPPIIPVQMDSRSSRELISSLTNLDGKTPVSGEQAQAWKQALQQLVRQGASAIPDIQAFLAQNQQTDFTAVGGTNVLGYASLRSGLIDALAQIGGADANQAMLQILQTSTIPSDVADLAKAMGQDSTGQYQQEFLAAIRQQLFLAAQPDSPHTTDVGPLFQVLAAEGAGGATVAQDIQQYGATWAFYSAMTLAGLPQGAGLPALVQMAQTPGGGQTVAMDYLAQMSLNNPDALNSLLDMARTGAASDFILTSIAPFLAGRQFVLPADSSQIPPGTSTQTIHMNTGNQNFLAYDIYNPNFAGVQIGVIDKLLQVLPSTDTSAIQALQQQRNTLSTGLAK